MSRKSNKYYILHRNDAHKKYNTVDAYVCEFDSLKHKAMIKRIDRTKPLVLVEKTCNADNTETYTNMWTISEGCESNWTQFTKGRIMYDYTGIVKPLIHENGIVKFFN